MEGKAEASRDADELDPLALTLGSMYAAAATAAPNSPPLPPPAPMVAPHPTHRRLNNGTTPINTATVGAPASPPSPVAPRATRLRLNNGLASIYVAAAPASPPPPPPPSAPLAVHHYANRAVRRPYINPRATNANDLVQAPFPWATKRPAQHDTLHSLLCRGVTSVEGQVQCKRCGARKSIAYDLESKFLELREYIVMNRHVMYDRAPKAWAFPVLPDCDACRHKGAMLPEIATDKHKINWLFLFLGQMLGCCTLEHLKYFCKNNGRHRTGAKNRVLYYAYIEMCNQLLSFD